MSLTDVLLARVRQDEAARQRDLHRVEVLVDRGRRQAAHEAYVASIVQILTAIVRHGVWWGRRGGD